MSLTTPREDEYEMPAEWEHHSASWVVWPQSPEIWRNNAGPAQKSYAEVINAIAKSEKVNVIVSNAQLDNARKMINNEEVNIIEMETNDSWVRDTGPTFVVNRKTGDIRGVHWDFNGWGGVIPDVTLDKLIGKNILEIEKTPRYIVDIIMEPGSFHVDGEGTLITTEECLLHKSRNPNLTKEQIEEILKKVIWLKDGVYMDEDTNGHVDNFACFARPGVVLLTWTDDKNDPQYARERILTSTTDAKGRKIEVVKLHQPTPMFVTEEEHSGFSDPERLPAGTRMPGNYTNFYITNKVIVATKFNDKEYDDKAKEVLSKYFPDREIIQIDAREVLLGGGIFHCITQQQPSGKKL